MEDLSLSLHAPPHRQEAITALHSVRKPPSKPWRKPEPPPPRVYRVDPRGFRRLVQKLTGSHAQAQQQQQQPIPRPLKDSVVPPPRLDLAPRTVSSSSPQQLPLQLQPTTTANSGPAPQLHMTGPNPVTGHQSPASLMGFMSPSMFSPWCSFPLLSPGTMASLD